MSNKVTMLLYLAYLVGFAGYGLPSSNGTVSSYSIVEGGKVVNPIAEKIFVEINGVEQGMFIKGNDASKPVILLVHGGPGLSDYFLAKEYLQEIENEFVVCYWEQRGTGISYNSNMKSELWTTDLFVLDVLEVTNYLRDRFGQDKVYLMGHSWGSFLCIKAVEKSPELFHAYIAISQVVNQSESEKMGYTYMLDQYTLKNERGMVNKLKKFPIYESEEKFIEYRTSMLRDDAMHDLGVGTMRNMKSIFNGIFMKTLRCTDYTISERINIWRGKVLSAKSGLLEELFAFNAINDVPKVEIPVYFFSGLYDYTCSYTLQRNYYEHLNAPLKGFYTFKESAHSPLFEEPVNALHILLEDVLKGNTKHQDRDALNMADQQMGESYGY